MIKTVIKKGSYQDSVVLMLLTNKINAMEGINKVSIMMATPANKDIFRASGLDGEELNAAGANDMAIVVDVEREDLVQAVLDETEDFLKNQASKNEGKSGRKAAKNWEQALKELPDANLAVFSIPGIYAAAEADRALDEGLHVFMFSDNVKLEDEVSLKKKAHEKGLLVMGPDCGTGIIQGVPIAFTNKVTKGNIGIVGASGTGIQELITIIDRLGEGVTNAIGTGGRDLASEVGGITMLDSINAMEQDPEVKIVIVISKPPAKEVRDKILKRLSNYKKPVVTLFLGEKPEVHTDGFYHAYTLDEAARIAVQLARGEKVTANAFTPNIADPYSKEEKKTIKAYYSGGTLASEAAMMFKDTMGLDVKSGKKEGFMLNHEGHIVVDLGDDVYTQGKPHPMIDPAKRIECMEEAADDETTGVILFDIVLGYGSHEDMAKALLPAIQSLKEKAEKDSRKLFFVTTVCGTRLDPQGYDYQKKLMEDAGVIVCESNKQAVETALFCAGYTYQEAEKEIVEAEAKEIVEVEVSQKVKALFGNKPKIINIGLQSFAEVLREFDCEVEQFDWAPAAGGDMELIQALSFLRNYTFA
ncbi:acyl-CoA synthetase FdrA [Faecalicatena contorta]|uniref:FdrA protein n=1 Tax=Faecalicatena contorta TaxID=39482 RepID=A0A315ZT78_9FIRM|nr:acyl-CoA synthetase FdrA [Faecalicatena contorta]PWJ48766.1 FdrA protein [Faecalicatena contorta]SUQ15189.1 FdrA protein [Faecalicatena contorta]